MNYLITGGAGFIGTHLAEKLMERGHRIYSLDNLSTGSIENVDFLKEKFGDMFHHKTLDLDKDRNDGELAEYIDRADLIFHLAAVVGVEKVERYVIETITTNIAITSKVIGHAKKKMKPVVFTSTSEVYGKNSDSIFREDGNITLGPPTQGRWGYGASKYLDEIFVLSESKESGLQVVIARLFNTIGPRQTGVYGMVVPRFIKAALTNNPLIVYGNGEQERCFTYVDDVTDALILLSENSEANREVINVGNPDNQIKIIDLAKLVIKLAHSKSRIEHLPEREDMMKNRTPDIGKITRLTGWVPKTNLRESLEKIIKYKKGAI